MARRRPQPQRLKFDRLPVVILQVDKEEERLLVDTAATSFLNAKSCIGGHAREVQIHSWNETTILHASDVSIEELSLGGHVIRNVELPAIDLTAISKACGGQLDGILGVDLLDQLEVTIDLECSVARLSGVPRNFSDLPLIAEMEKAIVFCSAAFNNADAERRACFDPEFALSSPRGELHGRDQAVNYFQQYFSLAPRAHLSMKMSDQRALGELVWSLYDYTIENVVQAHIRSRDDALPQIGKSLAHPKHARITDRHCSYPETQTIKLSPTSEQRTATSRGGKFRGSSTRTA